MNIIGQQKSSFIDYPDKISTVYFTGECNFRCGYCHNKDLVNNIGTELLEDDIFSFLNKRKKFIDAVCISGGEPTLQKDLYSFICKLKEAGFFVKLDTNGYKPEVLEMLLRDQLLDYIAMDVKAPLEKYEKIAGIKIDIKLLKKSISLIKSSNIDYEFRTTVCREFLCKDDIIEIAKMLEGSKKFVLQNFKDRETVLCGMGQLTPYNSDELMEISKQIEGWFEVFKLRK